MSPSGQPPRASGTAAMARGATGAIGKPGDLSGLDASGAPRHLLSTRDVSAEEWSSLLSLAERMTGSPGRKPLLNGLR
ncbi:MAG: hypothetical protein ACYTCU_00905, partial [Planctomycetota bacterium]